MSIKNAYELQVTKDYYNSIDNELDSFGLRLYYLDNSISEYEKTLEK